MNIKKIVMVGAAVAMAGAAVAAGDCGNGRIVNWPNTVASSWLEIVTWGVGIAIGTFGIFKGLYLFKQSNKLRRADMLKTLLDNYNGGNVAESVGAIDSDMVVFSDGSIQLTDKDKKSIHLADPALLFFANVCYLRQMRLISSKEFSFFKWKLQGVLEHSSVQAYVRSCASNDEASPYKLLLRYKKPITRWQKICSWFND